MVFCDFGVFQKLKNPLKVWRYDTRKDIMKNSIAHLRAITKSGFQKCSKKSIKPNV